MTLNLDFLQLKFQNYKIKHMGNNPSSNSELIGAVSTQNCELAVKLLRVGGIPNSVDSAGRSCLRIALENGDINLFKILFDIGAKFLPPLVDTTPLHISIELGHSKMSRYFLRNQASFPNYKNSKDRNGQTPLHIAALKGNSELVALLLKYNAHPNIRDIAGKTPKDIALSSDSQYSEEIIDQFLMEDLVIKTPNSGKLICSESDLIEPTVKKETTSKSTHGSTTFEQEESSTLNLLEETLKKTRIPIIKTSDLIFEDLINRGSSCLVFKGKWRGTEVAIKQFKLEYSTSFKDMQKFVKEIQILDQVRHPNLILLMGICVDKPNFCLISELIPNCSLFQALHKRKDRVLNLSERFHIAIQITQGLAYMHSNNPPIVHRDLKPENCLVNFI